MARRSRAVPGMSFIRAAPLPLLVILGMGQPMLRSTMSAPSSSQRSAARAKACGSRPRSCIANGRSCVSYAAMSCERGVSIRRAKASISSVVVSPLPHSLAISLNGALLMAAIGARRQSSGTSTEPIFMIHQLYTGVDDGRPLQLNGRSLRPARYARACSVAADSEPGSGRRFPDTGLRGPPPVVERNQTMRKRLTAGVLDVAYEETGTGGGTPVFLLHGFPYDVRAFDEVTLLLAARGCRVIVPYLRGYGPTRFLSAGTPRSGQQAVLGHDLLALMDALGVPRAVLAGYDWGGRAACIVAALWPERALGLVSCGGYNIQAIAGAAKPQPPENEYRYWYQYYFHGERGRAGLAQNRRELCRLLWRLWSPSWRFDDATYERTAVSFDNPDFVEVVIHSYRHRFALVAGDPAVEKTEQRLSTRPRIAVPTVVLHGGDNAVIPASSSKRHAGLFSGRYQRRVLPHVGHNVPQRPPMSLPRRSCR